MEKEQRKPALHAVGCSRAVTCEPHRGPALNLNRFRGLTRKWVSFKSPQVGLLQISRRFSRAVYLSLCLDSRTRMKHPWRKCKRRFLHQGYGQ